MHTTKVLRVLVCIFLILSLQILADNLIRDPDFTEADFGTLIDTTSWYFYPIEEPSEIELMKDKGAIEIKGRKTFVHSSVFKVEPDKLYSVSLKIQGKGKVSMELLWWEEYSKRDIKMSSHHLSIALKPLEIKEEVKTVKGKSGAPEDAHKVYLRIVVEDGTLIITDPLIQPVED